MILLEIFLCNINLKKTLCCIEENHETCVEFKFLESINFELSHKNTSKHYKNAPVIAINRGKSCLLSLNEAEEKIAAEAFIILVDVWQKLSCSCLPSKFALGSASVNITSEYNLLATEGSKLQNSYPFFNPENEEVGSLDLIIRIANLEKMLITEMPTECGTEAAWQQDIENATCNLNRNENIEPTKGNLGTGHACDPLKQLRDINETCYCAGNDNVEDISGIPEYEEIGATLNGNQIKIRVPKNKNNAKANYTPSDNQNFKLNDKKTGLFLNVTEDYAKQGVAVPYATELAYSGYNPDRPTLTIAPNNVPPGVEALKLVHPNKDVFQLRINKKSNRGSGNPDLELELVTPKGPEKKPPPMSQTVDTQYDTLDIIPSKPVVVEPEPKPESVTVLQEEPKKQEKPKADKKGGKKDAKGGSGKKKK